MFYYHSLYANKSLQIFITTRVASCEDAAPTTQNLVLTRFYTCTNVQCEVQINVQCEVMPQRLSRTTTRIRRVSDGTASGVVEGNGLTWKADGAYQACGFWANRRIRELGSPDFRPLNLLCISYFQCHLSGFILCLPFHSGVVSKNNDCHQSNADRNQRKHRTFIREFIYTLVCSFAHTFNHWSCCCRWLQSVVL